MIRLLDVTLIGIGLIGFMWSLGRAQEEEEERAATLRHVQLMFRGGLHALDYKTAFPNLPNTFPDDKAELTRRGKYQMYELGKKIRDRYGSLWNYTYNPYETGTMLLGLRDECPAMWFVKQSQQYQNLNKKYEELIAFLCTNAGAPRIDLHNAFLAATSLAIYFKYNSTQFMWANTTVMEESIRFYWEVEDWLASIPEMRRLSAGWFLQIIIEEIVMIRKFESQRKMVAYSSHDDNIASFTSTLVNYLPSGFPDYGDYIAVELHSVNGSEYIEVWRTALANDTEEVIRDYSQITVILPGCPEPCSVEKFEKWARYYIPLDWNAECYGTWTQQYQDDELPGEHSAPIGILITVNALLLIFTLIVSIRTCKYRRNLNRERKSRKDNENYEVLKNYDSIEPVF